MPKQRRSRGQLQSRGANRWLCRVYLGLNADEKRQYTSKTVRGTRTEAERVLSRMITDADGGLLTPRTGHTVEEFLTEWLDQKRNIADRTRNTYAFAIEKRIAPYIGRTKLEELSPRQISTLYSTLEQEGLSPRSIGQAHAVLRTALRQAVKWEVLRRNPLDAVEPPRQKQREATIWTPEEAERFLRAAEGHTYRALYTVLLTTGIRPQEALALEWDDLDLEDGWLHVRRAVTTDENRVPVVGETKTDKSRRAVALPALTVVVLREYRQAARAKMLRTGLRHALVFHNKHGGIDCHSRITRQFKRLVKSASLPEIRLYDLRHSHLSHLLLAGTDLKLISSRAGHSTITLTANTYCHVLPESERQMADTVDGLYAVAGAR